MTTFRRQLRKRHQGQPVKPGSMEAINRRVDRWYDNTQVVTSCGICLRVIHRGPALWGRVAAAHHRCREHPRPKRRKR
jgi:hypothetical protein